MSDLENNLKERLNRLGIVTYNSDSPPRVSPTSDCLILEPELQADDTPVLGGAVPEVLSRLCRAPGATGLDLQDATCLDVESTGLGRGPGTYAFLIGLLDVYQGEYRIRQLFMRHPGEEADLLERLTETLADCPLLLTFNGRSFDLPLLATRYQLQQQAWPLGTIPHLDLIWPARRLWRLRLGGASLARLETGLLGVQRSGDVPGHEIPDLYRSFLRTGEPQPLEPVFEHNARDLLSLASLARRLQQVFAGPDNQLDHPADWYCLGRCYESAQQPDLADHAYGMAVTRGDGGDLLHTEAQARALRSLSLLHKRRHEWSRAVALWQQMITQPGPSPYFAFEELAKYHEHRERDVACAMEVVEEALGLLQTGRLVARRDLHSLGELLQHRRARLERKLGRGRAPSGSRDR